LQLKIGRERFCQKARAGHQKQKAKPRKRALKHNRNKQYMKKTKVKP
jgi:hypothetical protein